jgi:Holliday junction resolvase
MRRAGKIDANQLAIVRAFRQCGATVFSLAGVGHGCPDLVVGRRGKNFLVEVKNASLKPSERRLTEDERAFHLGWNGQICVIETVDEAIAFLEKNS